MVDGLEKASRNTTSNYVARTKAVENSLRLLSLLLV